MSTTLRGGASRLSLEDLERPGSNRHGHALSSRCAREVEPRNGIDEQWLTRSLEIRREPIRAHRQRVEGRTRSSVCPRYPRATGGITEREGGRSDAHGARGGFVTRSEDDLDVEGRDRYHAEREFIRRSGDRTWALQPAARERAGIDLGATGERRVEPKDTVGVGDGRFRATP